MEVGLNHPLLREGLQVVVVPSDSPDDTALSFLGPLLPEVLPIVIYAISKDDLSDQVRRIPGYMGGEERREGDVEVKRCYEREG